MSKLTDILGLFKYDPETDGANTFNITQALNNNWDKIDQLVLLAVAAAAAYDPEGSYAVGDYCTHGGKLHKCGTAIPDGEPWTAEHWTETSVAEELAEVRASLSNKVSVVYQNPTSLDELLAMKNVYAMVIPPATGMPYSEYWQCVVWADSRESTEESYTRVVFASPANKNELWKLNVTNGVKSGWVCLSDRTPPQEHAIVPKNGATLIDGMKNVFSKDQFGKLELHVGMNFSSVPAKGTEIFSLPQSFAPVGGIVAGAMILSMGTACYPAFLTVNTDGAVVLQHNVTDYSGQIDLFGFMCFGTGGTQ